MSGSKIGVFPASGGLGGSTLKHLVDNVDPSQVVAIVRTPKNLPSQYTNAGVTVRGADYDQASSLDHTFDGISTLNLISYASIEHEHRFKVHKIAIDAARKSGVQRILYSSLAFAGDGNQTSAAHVMQAHLDTEKYLASLAAQDSSFKYTVVRIGLYSESFPLYTAFFDPKKPSDEVKIPHDGKAPGIAWAKQDELGNAVSLLLKSLINSPTNFEYLNRTILLSGPRAWSLQETVEALGRVSRKTVKLREVSVEEYASQPEVQNGLTYGAGDLAAVWATAFEAIRRGEAAVTTPILAKILGREPESFEDTIAGLV
ncbi:NmrA-like family protein [Phlyctema vagabunda]|uniref:NmrA-like family protein n=1 Tax=Phlyctema vagabunda TaxID=108571 RepID=A0ABR4P6A8_9HELO